MTLRLRKSTQAELVIGMAKGPAISSRAAAGAAAADLVVNLNLPSVFVFSSNLYATAASAASDDSAKDLYSSSRRPVKVPMLSPRSPSPAASSSGLTLDAFASSLALEEGAKPSALQPLINSRQPLLAPMSPFRAAGAPLIMPASLSGGDVGGSGLLFEVELWRSDLLTSVLEVNFSGELCGGGLANPLCPPGEWTAPPHSDVPFLVLGTIRGWRLTYPAKQTT